jgi:hypothetical protein
MKKYFVFSDGGIYDFFDTEEDAIKCAKECIIEYLDGCEWTCENDDVFWGEIKQTGVFEKVECNPDAYIYDLEDI